MAKGFYHYIREAWKKPDVETLRKRMIDYRKSESIVKLEKPTRLDRARSLGYKAKPGVIIVRVRVMRGGRSRTRPNAGRRSKRQTSRKTLWMNYKEVAEQRVARKFRNLEVVNSYWVAQDGIYYWYEVILVDPSRPEIAKDKFFKNIIKRKGRAFRGLTSAGRKARGIR